MADKVFADGIRFFNKHEKAPDWVLGTLVITPTDLFEWLKANAAYLTEYSGKKQLKIQIAKGQNGKLNGSVDTWKPGDTSPAASTSAPAKDPAGKLPWD
jgi:hypothetical protein